MKTLILKMALIFTVIAVSATVRAADLISYWNFDNGGDGTYILDDGGVNPAKFAGGGGGTFTNNTPNGSAYAWAAADDGYLNMAVVSSPADLNFERTNAFSVVGWVYRNDADSQDYLISKQNNTSGQFRGWAVGFDNNQRIRFFLWQDFSAKILTVNSDNNAMSVGTWIHVAVTYDGSLDASGVVLYVNGVAIKANIQKNGLNTTLTTKTTTPVNIGGRANNNGFDFNGMLDDVAVYSGVLTPAEVADIYNNGVSAPTVNPISLWRFDGSAVDTADGNNGTVVGSGSYTNDAKFVSALHFDAAEGYVNIGDKENLNFEYNDAFTIMGWVKRGDADSQDYLISKQNTTSGLNRGWAVGFDNNHRIRFWLWQDYDTQILTVNSGNNAMSLDTWVHVAVTYDGSADASGVHLYKDGKQIVGNMQNNTLTTNITTKTTTPVNIGGRNNAFSFNGTLDEVAVYGSVLTSSQIWDVCNNGIRKKGTMIIIK